MLSKRAWSLEAGLISRNDLLDRLQQENIPFNKEIYDIIVGMPEVHDDRNIKSIANDIGLLKFQRPLAYSHDDEMRNNGFIDGANEAIAICYKYIRESSDEKVRSGSAIDRFNDRYFFGVDSVPKGERSGARTNQLSETLHSDVPGDSDTGSSEN